MGQHTEHESLNPISNLFGELIWPSRCAVCDKHGVALCRTCALGLHYINPLFNCPTCGSPFGLYECSFCCPTTLNSLHRETIPYATCHSALHMTKESGHILSVYKDAGEQSLAYIIAGFMAHALPPRIRKESQAIIYLPDSEKAFARRGFDHAQLIAKYLSLMLDTQFLTVFNRPLSVDQRKLDRKKRMDNMKEAITINERSADAIATSSSILLIDDVMTTGATLLAACDAIGKSYNGRIDVLTFIRG